MKYKYDIVLFIIFCYYILLLTKLIIFFYYYADLYSGYDYITILSHHGGYLDKKYKDGMVDCWDHNNLDELSLLDIDDIYDGTIRRARVNDLFV